MLVHLNKPHEVSVIVGALKYGPVACTFEATGTQFAMVLAPLTSVANSLDVLNVTTRYDLLVSIPSHKMSHVFYKAPTMLEVAQEMLFGTQNSKDLAALIGAVFNGYRLDEYLESLQLIGDGVHPSFHI